MPACGITITAPSAANHVPSASGSMGTISSGVEPSSEAQQFRMASREAGGILSRCNAFLIDKQCLKNIVKRYNNSVKNDQRCFSISLTGTGRVLAENKVKICLELVLPTDMPLQILPRQHYCSFPELCRQSQHEAAEKTS